MVYHIPLIMRFLFVLSPALSYVIGHAFLVVYSLYRNRYGNRLLDIFYGLFPIIIESLVHNLIIYGIALVINRHYLIVLNHFHLNLVIELLVFPVFWLNVLLAWCFLLIFWFFFLHQSYGYSYESPLASAYPKNILYYARPFLVKLLLLLS
mgnify:CR=1 FL=1